jgi:hypothetical protein
MGIEIKEDDCEHRFIQMRVTKTESGYSGYVYCTGCSIILSEVVHSKDGTITIEAEHYESVGIIKPPNQPS